MKAIHVEGRVGELIDGVLTWLRREMGATQVVRDDGQVADALDVPAEVLREMAANALMHRSFTDVMSSRSVTAELNDDVVVVRSPGGLDPSVSLNQLGVMPVSVPRNYGLVRLCEVLVTPSGARVVESQASGIPAMDRACASAGLVPVLFEVEATLFTAVAVRGRLDLDATRQRHPQLADANDDVVRLAAVAERLWQMRDHDVASAVGRVEMDLWLAQRTLPTLRREEVAVAVDRLRALGVVRREERPSRAVWVLDEPAEEAERTESRDAPPLPGVSRLRREAIWRLLEAVAAADELRPGDADLGVSDRTLRTYFRVALDAGLLEPTTTGIHDPTRAYRLSDEGRRALRNRG